VIYTLSTNLTEASIARVNDVRWIVFVAAVLFATDAVQRGSRFSADDVSGLRDRTG
jgi:hypothetical protein